MLDTYMRETHKTMPGTSTNASTNNFNAKILRFPLEEKRETLRNTSMRNHNNCRNFHINENLTSIYNENLRIQSKLDHIQVKGAAEGGVARR